jgi:hypothetical protein
MCSIIPGLQLLSLALLGVLPDNTINGNIASLSDDLQFILVVAQLLQHIQTIVISKGTKSLSGFVTAHRILLDVLDDMLQVRNGVAVESLAKAVGQLVLQESGF